ncbi:hypothetical protein [Microbulbifer pacificus]|uniref:Lipoprotein n=1 Tax=Microbulbifer pacificus TaxID=407164 RepID=A0AAU0N4M8_9GAMM|nr:hypothetical protein [Microbulbifer pacificus]WOX06546.1 hypothetical protein R5R33_05280 [Microbulbifer pacificus]
MNRSGIAVVAMSVTLCLQGCIFVPFENEHSYDPFFFNPDDKSQTADFVEVGNYLPNTSAPPAASRQCSTDVENARVGSACWFFPVMRVY